MYNYNFPTENRLLFLENLISPREQPILLLFFSYAFLPISRRDPFFFVDEDIDEVNCLEACEVLGKEAGGGIEHFQFHLKNYILLLLLLIILLIINKLSCRVVSRMLAFQSAMMFRRR